MFEKSIDNRKKVLYDGYRQGGKYIAKREIKEDKTIDQRIAEIERQYDKR